MLKIMTLNLNYYGDQYGPWSIRKELVCNAIREESPDVIAFQAVYRDPGLERGLDQAAQIAEVFPEYENVLFQPAMESPVGFEQGSAFLSRISWRMTGCKELTLIPGLEDENRRVLLSATFELSSGALTLFNGHFSWVAEQARINVEEALRAGSSVEGLKILVGDFNITPESKLLDLLKAAGWIDVWSEQHPQEDGFTFIEAGRLAKRIDYVWMNEDLKPYVRDVHIAAAAQHEIGARVSDHVGLLAELNLDSRL